MSLNLQSSFYSLYAIVYSFLPLHLCCGKNFQKEKGTAALQFLFSQCFLKSFLPSILELLAFGSYDRSLLF